MDGGNLSWLIVLSLFLGAVTAYAMDCKECLIEASVRVWKLSLKCMLFCRLTDAIQICCAYQSLQTLSLRLLTRLHEGVRYIVDLPSSLRSLKLTVWDESQVDALMRLSSLKVLDLELGFGCSDAHLTLQQKMQKICRTIKEVIATFKSVHCKLMGVYCICMASYRRLR